MRQIAAEFIGAGDTEMTRLDAMLRQLWTSRNPAHNKMALQVLDPNILIERMQIDYDWKRDAEQSGIDPAEIKSMVIESFRARLQLTDGGSVDSSERGSATIESASVKAI